MNKLKKHFVTVNSDFREGRVILLRERFTIQKKIKNAILYSTALGIYEARINREKVTFAGRSSTSLIYLQAAWMICGQFNMTAGRAYITGNCTPLFAFKNTFFLIYK